MTEDMDRRGRENADAPATLAPFFNYLGVSQARVVANVGTAEMLWRPEISNSGGYMHGGAIMAAIDAAMVQVVRAVTGGQAATLAQFSINLLSNGSEGVVAEARITRAGSRAIFLTGEAVQSGSGRLVATASALFQRRV